MKLFYLFDLKINRIKFSKDTPVNLRSVAAKIREKNKRINRASGAQQK